MAAMGMERRMFISGQSLEMGPWTRWHLTFRSWIKECGNSSQGGGKKPEECSVLETLQRKSLKEGGNGQLSPVGKGEQRTAHWIWPDGGHINDLDTWDGDDSRDSKRRQFS